MVQPRFPIYIPSKSRHDSRITMRCLDAMNTPYFVIVEEQQFDDYAQHIDESRLLILPQRYKDEYETCDDLGDTKSKGAGPARNFAWDHSIESGYEWHWVMDDNIRSFRRWNKNRKLRFGDGSCFWLMEKFALRYKNVAIAGPHYTMFCPRKRGDYPPFFLNTRIYSCSLIRNDIPFRWRGRHNEDTILSIDVLKAKWCTILFNAFQQEKMVTQAVKGGNTAEFYEKEGRKPATLLLKSVHPDVVKLTIRWNRPHHLINYKQWNHPLIRKDDAEVGEGVNEYGMKVVPV